MSEDVTTMTAVASETWGLVFWQEEGTPQAAIVGPESRTSIAPVPPEASFVGIQFTVGTSLRIAAALRSRSPGSRASSRSFRPTGRS